MKAIELINMLSDLHPDTPVAMWSGQGPVAPVERMEIRCLALDLTPAGEVRYAHAFAKKPESVAVLR